MPSDDKENNFNMNNKNDRLNIPRLPNGENQNLTVKKT